MKLAVAVLLSFVFGLLVIVGLLKAVAGNPWWLILCVAVYLVGFVRFGCKAH